MTENNAPIINFKGYSIKNLEYTREVSKIKNYKAGFNYVPSVKVNNDYSKAILTLQITLKRDDEDFGIDISIQGQFAISSVMVKEGKNEIAKALFVNGTAILFPYARSIISMITGLDSSSTVLLPTVNTMELWKQSKDNNNQ